MRVASSRVREVAIVQGLRRPPVTGQPGGAHRGFRSSLLPRRRERLIP
jgi:hypothetical protein